ncbi:MAG: hypothetical protein R2749_11475 [Acidimicrobiales bacterium]
MIANNLSRKPRDLWTDQGRGDRIVRYHAEDEIDGPVGRSGSWPGCARAAPRALDEIAVNFYRTNAQSRARGPVHAGRHPYKVIRGAVLRPP